jgi:putative thioredoxin
MTNENRIAITLDNFQQVVVEESKNKLVLVNFWAEQIPESIELQDKLTVKLSNFSEYVILATIDCQTQGQIAQQFGIQGLPTAILIKDGQPLDGLTGPQDDVSIDTFLEKHLPKPEDLLLDQAKTALNANDLSTAKAAIIQAYQYNNERGEIKLVLADIYLQSGNNDEAKELLNTILMVDQDSYYHALVAKLELASQAADSPEIKALEIQLKQEPENITLSHQLAAQYNQVNRNEEALSLLFRLVQTRASDENISAEKSKEILLDILKSLTDGDPLIAKYRRKLYTLLY